ncbi:MAG: pyridoxamine 5-phosphate oxidase [Rhodobacteraceae bacterium]|nr:pyridoxamine 5-phosphate oxidase [Paracoccaceae bacterium]
MEAKIPLRPVDDEARDIARGLLAATRFGALGVLVDDAPFVTRVALSARGKVVSLVSSLAQHTQALKVDPRCSLLIGEPGEKGDPLTHARLTLRAKAIFLDRNKELRARWLKTHPKAKLYIDFGDFGFVHFQVDEAFLNGGFGYACQMDMDDLGLR